MYSQYLTYVQYIIHPVCQDVPLLHSLATLPSRPRPFVCSFTVCMYRHTYTHTYTWAGVHDGPEINAVYAIHAMQYVHRRFAGLERIMGICRDERRLTSPTGTAGEQPAIWIPLMSMACAVRYVTRYLQYTDRNR